MMRVSVVTPVWTLFVVDFCRGSASLLSDRFFVSTASWSSPVASGSQPAWAEEEQNTSADTLPQRQMCTLSQIRPLVKLSDLERMPIAQGCLQYASVHL